MNDGFGLKKTPSISVCDLGWITINGWLKKIHDTFKWVWVNTYRYIFSGLFTSINPSYDLGFTRGTRVLTHPQITNGRNPQEDSVTLRGTVPQCVASQCLYNLPWGERYVHNCSAVATWLNWELLVKYGEMGILLVNGKMEINRICMCYIQPIYTTKLLDSICGDTTGHLIAN